VLCASPHWIKAHGSTPRHPGELAQLPWLEMSRSDDAQADFLWRQQGTNQEVRLQVRPLMVSNHRSAVQQFCEAGLGLALLSAHDVAASLETGSLVHLLPDWDMGMLDIWAVTASRDTLPAKVREAIEVLREYFAQLQGMHN
jgi:DNA-binding transcriptional LysR family regulator